jgi:hypothetical protein
MGAPYIYDISHLRVKMEGKEQTGFAWLRSETRRELL